MFFTEFTFIAVFLPITLAVFCASQSSRRSILALTAASVVFYAAWHLEVFPLLALSVVANFFVARKIASRPQSLWFWVGVAVCLAPLFYFKYSGFLASILHLPVTTGLFGERLGALLPLGISFYTFVQFTYLADVRAGTVKPDSLLHYLFFVLFFPHLIAGPIIHYRPLISQIDETVDRRRLFVEGAAYFAIGFVKKVFIADTFGGFAEPVFSASSAVDTQAAVLVTLSYTLQLYFDFSGYSDMAMGLARMFGFQFPWNFDSPYKSRSVVEFWRRWHMTLSRFLRDYIYIPLGGNRHGALWRYRNLMLTMLVGGLWHGAAWQFVLWGGLHGAGLVANHLWSEKVQRPLGRLNWPITFGFVALLWVMFGAPNLHRAADIYLGFFRFAGFTWGSWIIWCGAGLLIVFLGPSSHRMVAGMSGVSQYLPPRSFRPLLKKVGAYSFISAALLCVLSFGFYNSPMDRWVYSHIPANIEPLGVSNEHGDLRNNLFSRLTIYDGAPSRIAIVGSSFTQHFGVFDVTDQDGKTIAVSQSFGIGGNGIMNGARSAATLAATREADVIVLGVSPLNFGNMIPSMPFEGQCLEEFSDLQEEGAPAFAQSPMAECIQQGPSASQALRVLDRFRNEGAFQFKNFVRNLTTAWGTIMPGHQRFSLADGDVDHELRQIAGEIEKLRADPSPVSNPANGRDETFAWNSRGVAASLERGALGYQVLERIKREADENGVRLLMYETPTPNSGQAPDIYPPGFYAGYKSAMLTATTELGIPYLDLSGLLPWSGGGMADFVHPVGDVRPLLHKILLSWIFSPLSLEREGFTR
ncbi:MAG: hypothetical protein JWR51_67 [Devosia sp.]|uniref:MBOAT family O-acyltransferase n=1 Tax=Devosia sp. TaxID=1871048 RepID=UPI002606D418|nr:MBOAT family protein [Devosia sp.]MDB5526964.1 hypothetical protein [Devosia sp.]